MTGNEAFAAMAGMPVEELEGVRMSDLMDHPDPEGAPTEREGIDAGWSEGRLRRPDGSRLEVELHTAELSLESEPILLSLVRDLTWRRRLERETLRVGEKERLLVGKELHDGLGQHLTGVAFMAKTLAAKLVDSQGSEAEEAVRISHLVRDAVGQIRVLSKGLELTEYEPGELPQALGEMADVVRRLMGVDLGVELDLDGEDGAGELDTFLATQLYRFCHDVVSDAVRNQLARKIDVVIRRDGRRVLMIVSHDGKRPQGKEATSSTLSDYRLRYRARLLDAALNVTEGEEGKTTITCSFDAGGART